VPIKGIEVVEDVTFIRLKVAPQSTFSADEKEE